MPIDLTKLTPAPWLVHEDEEAGTVYIPRELGGFPMLLCEQDLDPIDQTALEFAALARNAFDVMMRLKVFPLQVGDNGLWSVWCVTPDREVAPLLSVARHNVPPHKWPRPWPDPFTALVEIDKWYRENVEADAEREKWRTDPDMRPHPDDTP